MKKVIRYSNLFIGCLLIAISFNFLILPNDLISFGVVGLSTLIYHMNGITPALNILILNMIVILVSSLFAEKETIKEYLLPSILIPFLILITEPLVEIVNLVLPEMMVTVLVSGVLSGYGYSYIYKQGFRAGVFFLVEELIGKWTKFHSKIYSIVIDVLLLIVVIFMMDYQMALYSLVVIVITRYMITKARFGINDSKMFYVITSKEKEVKNYIMHDLKYELTVLDVKGGFSKKNNQIFLTVISSNDYYKLKEGIKVIDPKAFIAITDTYDVVNRKSF